MAIVTHFRDGSGKSDRDVKMHAEREKNAYVIVPVACLLAAALLTEPAAGQGTPSDGTIPDDAMPVIEEIVITGSRIRRSDVTTAAPVSIIDSQAMTDRGFIQVGDILNELTANSPSRPLSPFDGSSSGLAEQYPALLGLGPGRTLTLVNGRRFVSSSSSFGAGVTNDSVVDTNLIPTGLLDRVEVVQGGGAAVYGSDAMGGVVNYILRDDFEGLELDAQGGISSRSDYETYNGRITWGTNFDRGNIAANVEWSRTEPLLPADRPESSLGWVSSANPADTGPNDGIPSVASVFDARFWEFNANGILFAPPNPTAFPNRAFITLDGIPYNQFAGVGTPAQFNSDGTGLIPYNPGAFPSAGPSIPFASGGDGFRFTDFAALYSGVERTNANLIGHYDLTPTVRLSGELLYGEVEGEDPRASIPSNTILNSAATGSGPIMVSAFNPFLPDEARQSIIDYLNANPALFGPNSGTNWSFGAPIPVSLSKVFTDLLPSSTGTREVSTYRALLALDGDFEAGGRDYYWSTSISQGGTDGKTRSWGVLEDRFNNAVDARLSGGEIVCAINADGDPTNDDPACAPINPFGVGNVSDAATNYVSALFGQDYDNVQRDFLATIAGEFFALPAGDVEFSLAYEHREEEAEFTATEASRLGVGRSAVPAVDQEAEYKTNEFSLELLIPLIGNDQSVPFVEALGIDGAYRTVDNSIAGREDVWGIGLYWDITNEFTLRSSRSRNFRAPNLAQLFAPTTAGLETIGEDPCDVDRIDDGPNPDVRRANCEALFAANPGYGPLETFQDPAENFPTAQITRGGNPDLRNEISDTISYGVVYEPHFVDGLTLVADRIEIELTNGLSFFAPEDFLKACFDSFPQPVDICGITTRDANGHVVASAAFTFNAGRINVEGETYNVNYAFPAWEGNFELNLEATHISLLETSVTGVDLARTDDTSEQPEWRARVDARYETGPMRLAYSLYYLPSTAVRRGVTIESHPHPVVDANYRHSISAQYDLTDWVTVRGGIENVTDEGPSFPTMYYGDILGRRYYLGANLKF